MALTNEFIDAVSNNKKTRVRIMLKDMMLVDPGMNTFNEMLSYAEKNMGSLYDLHDGEILKGTPSEWSEDYMNQQMVSVVTNFSRERIELLENIVKKLYGNNVGQKTEDNKAQSAGAGSFTHKSNGGPTGKQIAGGVTALAGVGVLAGGIIGSNVPVVVIGGVAIAGGIALIATGGSKEE